MGANCGPGTGAFAQICRRLRDASGLPVWMKPNAGLPMLEGGQCRLLRCPPEAVAAHIPALVGPGPSSSGAAAEPAPSSSERSRGPPCHA